MEANSIIRADNPIVTNEEDVLGRVKPAISFAKHIMSLDTTKGVVVGVLGPWGSGKTSFVNLSRLELNKKGVVTLDFNPWMFSGHEQLVNAFFAEISEQLKMKPELSDIGEKLEDYGEAFSGLGWVPFVGPWIERLQLAFKFFFKLFGRKKDGITGRRKKIEDALAKMKNPIVVTLDDIDRLLTSEIRDIFKLVRLTANFPNLIYIVAFDRIRVEKALSEQGIPGRDYLEKILQIGIDLPSLPSNLLNSQVYKSIESALSNTEPAYFDKEAWPDVYMEIIYPLLRNMRDVRRYAVAIHGSVSELNGQIALVDVLALEAIRIFLPDVFMCFHECVDGLTSTYNFGLGSRSGESPHLKVQIDKLIQKAGERADLVKSMIQRLFPSANRHIGGSSYVEEWSNQWLLGRRVANPDIFKLYLERITGDSLQSFIEAEWASPRTVDSRRD